MSKCTAFKNFSHQDKPFYITIDTALDRIKKGASAKAINALRETIDIEEQEKMKKQLPCICFSGEFSYRRDDALVKHSGFIVLDFDKVYNLLERKQELSQNEYAYACWISPRNNGIKVLVQVADGSKHREHFEALRDLFPEADKSGVNESRICFESYDPEIVVNKEAQVFKKYKVVQKFDQKIKLENEKSVFNNIVKWLSNKGDAFQSGERNVFIFKLSSACCRFGLNEEATAILINSSFDVGVNRFSVKECLDTIASAYKANRNLYATAKFENDILVDRTSHFQVEVTQDMLDENIRPKDVVFGEDVKDESLDFFNNGYQFVNGIGITGLDYLFKYKEGEITLLSGYGNYGKSSFLAWKLLMRVIIFGEKFAFFTPEENPAEFYHNMVEMLLGAECTPANKTRPSLDTYETAYDFLSRHFFYVYPKTVDPTPVYIKERFLELIIKQKVKGVVIDPFNQLTNDYKISGGRSDKYLETFLSDCSRFARQNNIYFTIIAHPVKAHIGADGNYPCPNVFDIADGAMWNNKMDNILIYDRPNHQKDPNCDVCHLHTKKIRRQKIVGKKGEVEFNFNRLIRRFIFDGRDPMQEAISQSKIIPDGVKTGTIPFNPTSYEKSNLKPFTNFYETTNDDFAPF